VFAAWGHLVYRRRWVTLALSIVLLVASGLVLSRGGTLRNNTFIQGEAQRGADLLGRQLPSASSATTFDLIFGSASLKVADPRFRRSVQATLQPLLADRRVSGVTTPYNEPPTDTTARIGRDGRHALVTVTLKDDFDTARHYYGQLRALIHSDALQVTPTGDLTIAHDYDTFLDSDLQRAERVSLPLALLLLLVVFGTVVAALLPLGVGVLAVVGGLAGVFLLSRATDVSQYALNVVTLIGLGVAIDYSLFVVSRFREELARGASVEESLAQAMATSGRAVTFSGLTVAIGLSGLLFYQGTALASMGAAGAIVVGFAILYGLTFLPALLALVGTGVNRLRLPGRRSETRRGLWRTLAEGVMRRPVLVLAVTVPLVLLAGSPFLQLRLASGNVTGLPPNAESYRGYDLAVAQFPALNETYIDVVVDFPSGPPLTAARVGALYDLSRRVAALSNVQRVEGPLNVVPSLGRSGYQKLLTEPRAALPAPIREVLRQSVGTQIVALYAVTRYPGESDQARGIVKAIRRIGHAGDGQILVTGTTAFDLDTVSFILSRTPVAVAYIVAMTCLVLFLLLGSVVLPFKAVLTDGLSISASFGAMVWIFQQGHFQTLLNITPSSIDPFVPVLLFCIVFGLSMDYEVLLLSRIKEAYERDGDNRAAVAEGLERSGRLITGAAAIMVVVFAAFALANVVLIKAIGLGMAIAVAVDATIIRALVVPAVMRLLGRYNWWAPHPLARLYRRLNLGEPSAPAESRRTA
jgi:RND superfamily putative drug exporter